MSASENAKKEEVRVVALALKDASTGEYMLARRSGGSGAGEWEFPGGKIENNEDEKQALVREIQEEMSYDLDPHSLRFLGSNGHEYPKRKVLVSLWGAEVKIKPDFVLIDHDLVLWIRPEKMGELSLSKADKPFISLLK